MSMSSAWLRACCRNCAPGCASRPAQCCRTAWRRTCCSSAATPARPRPAPPRPAWPRCAAHGVWSSCRRPTTRRCAWAALTRPCCSRRASAWPRPRTPGRPPPEANCTASPACPSSSRWSVNHCNACCLRAATWPRRCRTRSRRWWPPARRRSRRWRWKWPPPSSMSTPRSRTVSSTTPRWPSACSAWRAASTMCAWAPSRRPWTCGWRCCTAASATARPWAAWCRNFAPRCRRSRSRSTSTFAIRRSARC